MTGKKLNKNSLTKLRRISSRAGSEAKNEHREKSRDATTDLKNGSRVKTRTPSLPPLPWKD